MELQPNAYVLVPGVPDTVYLPPEDEHNAPDVRSVYVVDDETSTETRLTSFALHVALPRLFGPRPDLPPAHAALYFDRLGVTAPMRLKGHGVVYGFDGAVDRGENTAAATGGGGPRMQLEHTAFTFADVDGIRMSDTRGGGVLQGLVGKCRHQADGVTVTSARVICDGAEVPTIEPAFLEHGDNSCVFTIPHGVAFPATGQYVLEVEFSGRVTAVDMEVTTLVG